MEQRILIIGDSSLDNIVTSDRLFYQHMGGGNCLHAAMGASRLSKNVVALCSVPSNFPSGILDELRKQGIDTSLIKVEEVKVDAEEFFFYSIGGDRKDGLFLDLHENWNGRQLSIAEIDYLKTAAQGEGYSYESFRETYPPDLLRVPNCWNVVSCHIAPTDPMVCRAALGMDIPIKTLDPGKYLRDMRYDEVVNLVSLATVFCPSKKELGWILPISNLAQAVARLGKDCHTNVICKNGTDGCVLYDKTDGSLLHIGTYPSKVADPTGAGDSFCGGLNAALAAGDDFATAARKATVVAAKAIERPGTENRSQIDDYFVRRNYGKVLVEEVCLND